MPLSTRLFCIYTVPCGYESLLCVTSSITRENSAPNLHPDKTPELVANACAYAPDAPYAALTQRPDSTQLSLLEDSGAWQINYNEKKVGGTAGRAWHYPMLPLPD